MSGMETDAWEFVKSQRGGQNREPNAEGNSVLASLRDAGASRHRYRRSPPGAPTSGYLLPSLRDGGGLQDAA